MAFFIFSDVLVEVLSMKMDELSIWYLSFAKHAYISASDSGN